MEIYFFKIKISNAFSLLASIARVIIGFLSDKFGGYKSTQISLIVVILGSIIHFFISPGSHHNPAFIIGLILLAIGLGA